MQIELTVYCVVHKLRTPGVAAGPCHAELGERCPPRASKLTDKMPPRGVFMLPENVVLAGLRFRRQCRWLPVSNGSSETWTCFTLVHRDSVIPGSLPPVLSTSRCFRDYGVHMRGPCISVCGAVSMDAGILIPPQVCSSEPAFDFNKHSARGNLNYEQDSTFRRMHSRRARPSGSGAA